MFVQKQRFGNYSSGENSEEDVSEGDILQVHFFISIYLIFFMLDSNKTKNKRNCSQ